MGESYERDGVFGKYTAHYDDDGNRIGESREREGIFGKYTEHTDADGNKIGESRDRDGFFGAYAEHTDKYGNKKGESREREGYFGDYVEHTDTVGRKTGESRQREGFFGPYTEHTGARGSEKYKGPGSSSSQYSAPSSTSSDNGCAVLVGGLIAVAIVVVIVIWLAVNVVLPILLLNSALGLTILAICLKDRRTLFSALSLVGGAYLLIDVFAGWLSVLFVSNVVGNPIWITGFAYLNAIAAGVSTWFLVQPLWNNGLKIKESDRNRSIAFMGGSVAIVIVALASIPLAYHLIPNRLGMAPNSSLAVSPGNRSGTTTTRPPSTADPGLPIRFNRSYSGTIGNQTVSITLSRDGDHLSGQASTTKNDTLSGSINNNGQFEMQGLENGERFTGIYKGTIFGNGFIQGTWTKPNGSKETAFSVSQTQ